MAAELKAEDCTVPDTDGAFEQMQDHTEGSNEDIPTVCGK
jgi:hypothetical protein